MLSSTATPAPSASQERAGCRRRGAWSRTAAIASTSSAVPTGQRTIRQTCTTSSDQPYSTATASANAPPATSSRKPRPTGAASTRGQHGGPAVLRERLPVPADPVDPVASSLDLTHGGRHRDECQQQAEHQRELAGALAAAGGRRARQRVAGRGAGGDALDRPRHHAGRLLLVDVGRQAGQGEQERQDGETGLQGQGAAVGEAVAVPEPPEGVDRDPAQAEAAGEVPGVLGVELVAVHLDRDRDQAGSRHPGAGERKGDMNRIQARGCHRPRWPLP